MATSTSRDSVTVKLGSGMKETEKLYEKWQQGLDPRKRWMKVKIVNSHAKSFERILKLQRHIHNRDFWCKSEAWQTYEAHEHVVVVVVAVVYLHSLLIYVMNLRRLGHCLFQTSVKNTAIAKLELYFTTYERFHTYG